MTVRTRLDALLARRLHALAKHLPSALALDVKGVHQSRVASRRIREALPVFVDRVPEARLRKVRRRARRVTRALGPVREFDVSLETLDAFAREHVVERDAVDRVRRHLLEEREAAREWMRHRIGTFDASRLARRLSAAMRNAGPVREHAPEAWRDRLAARIRTRASALQRAIDAAGALYLPDRLHVVRIAVKKLRYALELAAETRSAPAGRTVRSLKRMQDTLGRLHDLEVVAAHVQRVQCATNPRDSRLLAGFDELGRTIENECRRRHARYVTRRMPLIRLAETAMEEMAPRVSDSVHV